MPHHPIASVPTASRMLGRRMPGLKVIAVGALQVALAGCGTKSPPPATPAATPASVSRAATDVTPSTTTESSGEMPATDTDPSPSSHSNTETTVSSHENTAQHSDSEATAVGVEDKAAQRTTSAAEQEPEYSANPERILILLPHGPVIVDVHLVINSMPYQETLTQRLNAIFAIADEDDDGQVTWRELFAVEAFQNGQFGNPPTQSEDQRKEQSYRCDLNRDGRVQLGELQLFLSPMDHGGHRIKVNDQATQSLTTNDAIFNWLDADQDHKLSISEQQACRQRLMLLDVNDDGVLETTEVPSIAQNSTRSARSHGATSLVWLHENTDWPAVLFLLEERYAFGSPLQASDFAARADLFETLDTDHDGMWSLSEWKMMWEAAADAQVWFSLDDRVPPRIQTPPDATAPITVEVREPAVRIELAASSVVLEGPESRQDVWDTGAFAKAFADADKDSDGVLNAEEFMPLGTLANLTLSAADSDKDGHVGESELASVLERREGVAGLLMTLTSNRRSSPLLFWLDSDSDGRLGERELTQCQTKLKSVVDASRPLSLADFPTPLRIEFERGTASATLRLPPTNESQAEVTNTVPQRDWFDETDRNGDGELSRREFIGSARLFDQLDTNGDGFVTRQESQVESQPVPDQEDQ